MLQCSHPTYWPLWWTYCRRPCSSVVMYSSTYWTFHHVLYLFDEVYPQTIKYSPGVHLSLACVAMQLVQHSIPPFSHSLWPCNFVLNCDIAIMTATLQLWLWLWLQHCNYCNSIPGHHCNMTILHSCNLRTMRATPDIIIKGHPRPYSYPLLLWHHEQPQPLGLTVFVHLSVIGSPINGPMEIGVLSQVWRGTAADYWW